MKFVLLATIVSALLARIPKGPALMLSEITQLRNQFKAEGAKTMQLQTGRKLSVNDVKRVPTLNAHGSASPRSDRYLKPIIPRNLESADAESIDPMAGKILKIEQINEKTGAVERVLRLKDHPKKAKQSGEARQLKKVITGEPKAIKRNVVVREEAVPEPAKRMEKAKIGSLYKDQVHNTHNEYLNIHDQIQQHHQFNRLGDGKKN